MAEHGSTRAFSSAGRPALAGVMALGLGLAAAELAAGLLGRPSSSPVVAAGEWFIDVVPTWLAELAISLFGTADKVALAVGMAVVLLAAGAGIGLVAARRPAVGGALAVVLAAVGVAVSVARPDAGGLDAVPGVVAAVVAVPVLMWLAPLGRRASVAGPGDGDVVGVGDRRPGVESTPEVTLATGSGAASAADPAADARRVLRRRFLQAGAASVGLAVTGAVVGRWLGAQRSGVESARGAVSVDLEAAEPVVPSGADLEVPGSQPWRTPNDVFYRIDTAFRPPLVRPDEWRLRIHGMVEREIELGYDDLVDMGLVDHWTTLACVSNSVGGDLIGNALWTGVPIADVLALAGPHSEADAVLSTSHDGWTCGTPLPALTDGRTALFAVAMNGEPLPVEHGFPVRMVVPGLYGYVSATKWVVDLEVSRFDQFDAYWTTRGWSEQGPVKVSSRIDVPRADAEVTAGPVMVAGSAWAQHRGISAVEVRVDDGEWRAARLATSPTPDSWRQWVFEWQAEPGTHELAVRATTADGEVQTGETSPSMPDGATGWHHVTVTVT